MSMRNQYGSELLDDIFIYFMRTALRLQKSGVEHLPVTFDGPEPVRQYLALAMDLLTGGEPPAVTGLILQTQYDRMLASPTQDMRLIPALRLIKELSEHIHFDACPFTYLLETANLWQEKANEFACRTFYVNLPPQLQKSGGYDAILAPLAARGMLEPDNY